VTWDGNNGDFSGQAVPDNVALGTYGSLPFSTTPISVHAPNHVESHLNDGFYGNSNSHINGPGSPEPTHMGIRLAGLVDIEGIAFGRDNTGNFGDRSVGVYTLQFTTVVNPGASTPDGDWTTIGTVNYLNRTGLRHQYGLATDGGDPISATGIRIVLENGEICIDELELFAVGVVPLPRLFPAEDGGEIAANNLAAGATAFAKDVLAGRTIGALNDQTAGDASAWVGDTPDSFAGLRFSGLRSVRSFAFGRDNTDVALNRSLGEYTLQVTDVANPDETTPDEDWTSIGTILYEAGEPADPHLRHRFNLPLTEMATGIRLLTPDGAAIDELEVYADAYAVPPPPSIEITPAAGFSASWDGIRGDFQNSPVPDNLALASNGGIPFASNPSPHAPTHQIVQLNDGGYGNSFSHINGGGPNPGHMGIALPELSLLTGIAWGRDNFGAFSDRNLGTYTVQFTAVQAPDESTPDEDWTTIADFAYGPAPEALRHQYEIGTSGGGSIAATGVRIVLSNHNICIDEIELFGGAAPPPFGLRLEVTRDGTTGNITLRWESQDGRLYNVRSEADPSSGLPIDWPIFGGLQDLAATPPENSVTFPLPADPLRLFVVEDFAAPPESVFADNFESGQGQWTTGEDDLTGNTIWEHGTPSNVGPVPPGIPLPSGSNCFGTNRADNYAFDANTWLRSPAIPLTNAAGATLCYERFTDIEPGEFDWGTVSVLDASDDSVIAVIETGIAGLTADWEKVTSPIPAAALGKTIKLEFRLQSDDFDQGGPFAGFYIDDVNVTVP